MKSLLFSPAAESDMVGNWYYTADRWSMDQADRYTDGIRDACHDLASNRRQGRSADVQPCYMKYLIGSHVVYFRDHGDLLEVVRILHSQMDVNRHL